MASLCCPVNGADDRTAIRVPVMSSHAVFVMPAVAAVLVAAMTADLPYWLLLLAIFACCGNVQISEPQQQVPVF